MESHDWYSPYRQFDTYYYRNASTPNSSEESDCSPSQGSVSGLKTRSLSTKAGAALPPMLPPCRVCGERASGFHYGVNTCEACKVSADLL
jgi:hypothetical protein